MKADREASLPVLNGDAHPEGDAPSTRDRIMRAAAALFQTQGFAPTTMRTVATAAGLTPGALYWHFPSKEAILYSILLAQSGAYDRTLEPVRLAATPVEKLRLFIKAMIEWQVDRVDPAHYLSTIPFGLNHLLQSLAQEQREDVRRRVLAHHEELIQIIAEGKGDRSFTTVDPKVAGYAILNMCEYVVTWWTPDDPRTPEELVLSHQTLALRMLSVE